MIVMMPCQMLLCLVRVCENAQHGESMPSEAWKIGASS